MVSVFHTIARLSAAVLVALAATAEAVNVASWMSGVRDSVLLHQLVIPGTHDTCAYDAVDQTLSGFVITQSSSLTQQLERGIRYLDMRVNLCAGRKLCLFHGRYYLNKNFDSVVQDLSSFLASYPSETIVMRLMVEAVNDGIDLFAGKQGSIDGFQQLVETTYIDQNRALWVQTNQFEGTGVAATQLTLGAARGKIVLLWDSGTKTSRYGYDYGIVDTRGGWEFESNDALMNEFKRRADASGSSGGWYENPSSGLVFHNEWYSWFYSWAKKVPHAIDVVANEIQPRVQQELRNGHAMQKGIVSMDFPRDEVIQELIYASLNRFAK